MSLPQLKIGKGAKREHRVSMKGGRTGKLERLEVALARFFPATIATVGIPKRAVDSIAKIQSSAEDLEAPDWRRSPLHQVTLKARDESSALRSPALGAPACPCFAHVPLLHLVQKAHACLNLATIEQDVRLRYIDHWVGACHACGFRRAIAV